MKRHNYIIIWLTPLIFFQIYLSIVYLIFVNGPWDWPIDENNFVYQYLILAQIAIFFGYIFSFRKLKRTFNNFKSKKINNNNQSLKPFYLSLFISMIMAVPTCYARTGFLFPFNFENLESLGDLYSYSLSNRSAYLEYLRVVLCLPLFSFIPLLLLNWNKISSNYKIISSFVSIFYILIYINMGVNKGLFDLIIFVPWILYLNSIKSGNTNFFTIFARNKIYSFLGLLFLLFSFNFFIATQINREGRVGIDSVMMIDGAPLFAEKNEYFLSKYMSDEVFIGFASISRYLTQGYYALSFAKKIDYSPTYGLGNSMFVSQNIFEIFNINYFKTESFPGKLESKTGWSYYELWHSLYSWLISDFGLYGTLIIMFILAYLLSISWIKSIYYQNYIHVIRFSILLIFFFYIPANNQVLQAPETFVLFYWIFFFKKIHD